MKIAFAAFLLALVLAPAAVAAGPIVPVQQQAEMHQILGGFGFDALGYMPTKSPAKYSYQSNIVNSSGNLIVLANGNSTVDFTVKFLNDKLSNCGKGSQIKLTISGVTVYSKTVDVWRCLTAPGGKVVKIDAQGRGIARADLGSVVASAKRIAG